ncbi:MAG: hypothetical protein ACYC0K_09200, partial [Thermoleophilia bacterium]
GHRVIGTGNYASGVVMTMRKNVTIKNVTFSGFYYGAIIILSKNSVVYNNFLYNITQAMVMSGSGNDFSRPAPAGGNYWSNFDKPAVGCRDSNNDRICDSAYVFGNVVDKMPWTIQNGWITPPVIVDTTAPVIGAVTPAGFVNSSNLIIGASYSDAGGSGIDATSVTITLDGSTLNGCTVTVKSASCPVSSLGDGSHAINVSVVDGATNKGSAQGGFSVDATAPVLNNLQPGGIITADSVTVSADYSDAGSGIALNTVRANIDGTQVNGCLAGVSSVTCPSVSLPLGTHTVSVSVIDIAGNTAHASNNFITVSPDNTGPQITNLLPAGSIRETATTISADYTDIPSGVDPASVSVRMNNNPVTGCTVTSTHVDCPVIDLIEEATYEITVSASDTLGNATVVSGSFKVKSLYMELQLAGYVNNSSSLNGADGLDIQGNYAYVSSGFSNTLTIINISNPGQPTITSVLTDPAGRLDSAWGVTVEGNYAYVVTGYAGTSDRLTVVDISNPNLPRIVGSLQDHVNLDGALHIFVSGNYAYVTAPYANRVTIIDVSVPATPVLKGSIQDNQKLYRADGILASGNTVYAISHQLDGGSDMSFLCAIDVTNPAKPVMIGALNSVYFRGGDQMDITGNYLYVPGNLDHTFSIVDVSNPGAMTIVSHLTDHTYIGQSCFVHVAGGFAYLTSADTGRLTVIDITDVRDPRIVGSIQESAHLFSALYVMVSGNYAYVTSPGGTFSVIRIIGVSP